MCSIQRLFTGGARANFNAVKLTLSVATQFWFILIATVFFSKRFDIDIIVGKQTRIEKQWPCHNAYQ